MIEMQPEAPIATKSLGEVLLKDSKSLNKDNNLKSTPISDILERHILLKSDFMKHAKTIGVLADQIAENIESGEIVPNAVDSEVQKNLERLAQALSNFIQNRTEDATPAESFEPPTKDDVEKWMDQPKSSTETVPEFIARVYRKWLGRGLNRAHLQVDPSLSRALTDWLHVHKELPESLNLPNAYGKYKDETYTKEEYVSYKKVVAIMNREKYRKRKATKLKK